MKTGADIHEPSEEKEELPTGRLHIVTDFKAIS